VNRTLAIIALVVAVAYGAAAWVSFDEEEPLRAGVKVFLEDPSYAYERTPVSLPFEHTFTQPNENVYIEFSFAQPGLRYKATVNYEAAEKLVVRPFPERNDTVTDVTGREGDSWRYSYTEIYGENPCLVIEAKPGVSVKLDNASAVALSKPGTPSLAEGKFRLTFLLIAIAFPVFWLLRRWEAVSEWFLVALSTCLFLYLDPYFTVLLLAVLGGVYLLRKPLSTESRRQEALFWLFVLLAVAFLMVFKYAPNAYYSLFFRVGAIPLGLSYFFFRFLHVGMEWSRGMHTDLPLRRFLCFTLFFPTVPAGPIETIDGFFGNSIKRFEWNNVAQGVTRILIGYCKKAILVDFLLSGLLFRYGDSFHTQVLFDPAGTNYLNILFNLPLLLLYSYLDFSAYSDMAIGFGMLFGYRIMENFNWPVLSHSVAEYWNRYHMSLGNWVRRHVYFPVLMTTRATWLSIFLTFLTMGFWHHVTLNWGLWAIHQTLGVMLVVLIEEARHKWRVSSEKWDRYRRIWGPGAVLLTMFYMGGCYALIFFHDLRTALTVYGRYFGLI